MTQLITGIHHVTAIASDSQKNLDFYTGILGLRLVKKTVNFDASDVYHFYYGDEKGNPGTILTFFPYNALPKGRHGKGFLNTTTFSLPIQSLDYWLARLEKFGIPFKNPQERFGNEVVVYFEDGDGLGLELVFNNNDRRTGFTYGHIPVQHSIKGFYNVEIWTDGYERTGAVLMQVLDHKIIAESGARIRFAATDSPGNYVDIISSPESAQGRSGSGTVHHLAFATTDSTTQLMVREKVQNISLNPTLVKDRQYFKSIYFREPSGVLFEVATTDEGFTKDETIEHLGESFKLPPWFEKDRALIEQKIPKVFIQPDKFV